MDFEGLDIGLKRGNGNNSISLKFLSKEKAELTFPKHFSQQNAHDFIHENQEWLKKAYNRFISKKSVVSKDYVLYKGNSLEAFYLESGIPGVEVQENKIFIFSKNHDAAKKHLTKWLGEETRKHLTERKGMFLNYGISSIKVKNSKRRWGSCNSRKELTFNSKLISLPESLIEYIIYHEICHLFQMNHSKRFKMALEQFIPDYKEREKELKKFLIS